MKLSHGSACYHGLHVEIVKLFDVVCVTVLTTYHWRRKLLKVRGATLLN